MNFMQLNPKKFFTFWNHFALWKIPAFLITLKFFTEPYLLQNLHMPAFLLFAVVKSLSHVRLCCPMDYSTPGFSVLHSIPEFAQTHVHWVSDAIQPFHSLLPPFSSCPQSFPASGSFLQIGSLPQMAKVLELQLQHQSFQWIFRVDFL